LFWLACPTGKKTGEEICRGDETIKLIKKKKSLGTTDAWELGALSL